MRYVLVRVFFVTMRIWKSVFWEFRFSLDFIVSAVMHLGDTVLKNMLFFMDKVQKEGRSTPLG